MRYFLLIVSYCLTAHLIRAQSAPKNASFVDIKAAYPDSALYQSMLTFLDEEGFIVEKADPAKHTILTAEQRKRGSTVHLRIGVTVAAGVIRLRGYGSRFTYWSQVHNQPSINATGRVRRKSFRFLNVLGNALKRRIPGSTLSYGQR